jgi:hypothetical protein
MRSARNFRYTPDMKLRKIKRDARLALMRPWLELGAEVCTFVVILALGWLMCAL